MLHCLRRVLLHGVNTARSAQEGLLSPSARLRYISSIGPDGPFRQLSTEEFPVLSSMERTGTAPRGN